jgi:hypothetical protein
MTYSDGSVFAKIRGAGRAANLVGASCRISDHCLNVSVIEALRDPYPDRTVTTVA